MADPFSFTLDDPNAQGFLGQSPEFWRNLAAFGSNLATSANARTASGHLANGPGLAGPLGAATTQTMEFGRQNALTRAKLGKEGAETTGINIANRLAMMGMPFQEALTRARMGALQGLDGQQAAPQGQMQATPQQSGGGGSATVPQEYLPFYQEASARTGIPINVLVAQAKQESGFNPNAIGKAGEIGIHQIMPSTARDPGFGVRGIDPASLHDPRTNINFAADYLKARGGPRLDFSNPATIDAALKNYNGGGDPNYVANVRRYMGTGLQPSAAGPRPMPQQPTPGVQPAIYRPEQAAPQATPAAQSAPAPQAPQPAPAQSQAGPRTTPAVSPEIQQQAAALQQEAARYEQLANRAALLGNGIGGDPTVLRQTAMEKRKLADQLLTAGPLATVKEAAAAPYKFSEVRPGGALTQGGKPIFSVPLRSEEVITVGPNAGMQGQVFRSPLSGDVIAAPGGEAHIEGAPSGFMPTHLSPATQGRLTGAGDVEKHDIEHDRKIVETDLAHVVDNTIQGKLQMLKLRGLIEPSATGFAGETRLAMRNLIQTLSPAFADAFNVDASPGQELKKIATMGAGKSEREDQGAKGGLRLMQIYMEANPNLENQPDANKHMANMILLAHQLHEDYATGANHFYQQNREGFIGPEHKPYTPISKFDQTFIQKMRPEVYMAAGAALNGKPYTEWSKGLTAPQMQIVGGILQRADPQAQIDISGRMVPVTAFTKVIGPTDITGGGGGR